MKTINKMKAVLSVFAIAGICALAPQAASAAIPNVPTPYASQGTSTSYIAVSWAKVSGIKGYHIYRSTSSSFYSAVRVKSVSSTTTTLYDSSATPNVYYYYWVCPYTSNAYYYIASRWARGYRKSTSYSGSSSYSSYSSSTTLSVSGTRSVQVGSSTVLYLKRGSSYVSGTWSEFSSGIALQSYTTTYSGSSVRIYGLIPGTYTLYVTYGGRTYSTTITVTSGYINNGSGSGYSISGSSSLTYSLGKTANYYFYLGGSRVTSSSVAWSKAGNCCTMSDMGAYGRLKITGRPSGSYQAIMVYGSYSGRRGSKSVKLYR